MSVQLPTCRQKIRAHFCCDDVTLLCVRAFTSLTYIFHTRAFWKFTPSLNQITHSHSRNVLMTCANVTRVGLVGNKSNIFSPPTCGSLVGWLGWLLRLVVCFGSIIWRDSYRLAYVLFQPIRTLGIE